MGQSPRVLQPDLSPVHLFGARLRTLREAAGLSQSRLGQQVSYSGHLVGKIEKGERRPTMDFARRCDDTLKAGGSLMALAVVAANELPPRDGTDGVLTCLPAVRQRLDTRDAPEDGPIRPLAELRTDVSAMIRWRLDSDYARIGVRLPMLLDELHRLKHDHPSQDADRMLMQAYRAADAIADKYGLHDLSARIIDLMRESARDADDRPTVAAAEYVRAEVFFASGEWAVGRRLLERAAADVRPARGVHTLAASGALHMRAAVLAARDDDLSAAEDHIGIAAFAATQVDEGVYRGTAFGPASVRIHRISLALDAGDVESALRIGEGWQPPLAVPAERRAHFHTDVARAQTLAGRPEPALVSLQLARTIGSQHLAHQPEVKATIARLLADAVRPSGQLLNLARWVGLLPAVRSAG